MYSRTTVATPLGDLLAVASPDGLAVLEFTNLDAWGALPARHADDRDRAGEAVARIARFRPGATIVDGESPHVEAARAWLATYFAGRMPSETPPLDLVGTDFEVAVWRALCAIPVGETTSYGAIARSLALANGARAVGGAVGSNPIGILVPCHRVVGASGRLTGYGAGIERKRRLLGLEAAMTGLRLTMECT